MIRHVRVFVTTLLVLAMGCAGPRDSGASRPLPSVRDVPAAAGGAAAAASAPAPAPKLPGRPQLPDYLAYAALKSPRLEASFLRWKAALEKIPQVKALPDPRFTYQYYIQEVETRVGPQRNSVQLTQMFPWFGTLRLLGTAATHEAEAARQRYEADKLELFHEVKAAYCEYYYLARAVAITRDNVRLLKHLESVVRARYRVGAAGHPDLIRCQVELGKLEDRRASLQDMRRPAMAQLNAALGLPADRALPWPDRLEPPAAPAPDAQLVGWATQANPRLKALDAEIARADQQVQLARKRYWPDVTVGLTWIETGHAMNARPPFDDGKDPLMAMVSVNVPIWRGKLDASVRQARWRHLAAVYDRADRSRRLAAEVKRAAYDHRDAQRKVDLYGRVLIAKADESLKATEAAFRAGKATFTDLIDAQRIGLEFRLTHERALTDRASRQSRLEMLIGRPLPPARSAAHPAKP